MKVYSRNDLASLVSEVAKKATKIIAIEGEMGIGKSTYYAPTISTGVGGELLEIDQYIIENPPPEKFGLYNIDLEQLKSDLQDMIKNGKVVIEGILIRNILKQMGIKEYIHIYIESENIRLLWDNDYGQFVGKTLPEIFALEEKNLHLINPDAKIPAMQKQMIAYHFNLRPFEITDYKIIDNE